MTNNRMIKVQNIISILILVVVAALVIVMTYSIGRSATFAWDAYPVPVTGFKLYCARASNVDVIPANLIATITPYTLTSYTKNDFASGQWWCALTAYDSNVESVKSNEVTFTVPLPAPTGFKVSQAAAIMKAITGSTK